MVPPRTDDVVSADRTYAALIQSIVDAGGPAYAFIDLPAAPGSERRFSPAAISATDISTILSGSRWSTTVPNVWKTRLLRVSRRSILAVFEFNGQRVNLINNHFSSKWGSSPLFGRQPMITGGAEERPAQARAIRRFLREQNAWRDQTHWIVLGDFNDHWFSETLDLLKGDESRPLHNLIETLPRDDRWTYIFEGTGTGHRPHAGHADPPPSLLDRAEFQVIHINARHINQDRRPRTLAGPLSIYLPSLTNSNKNFFKEPLKTPKAPKEQTISISVISVVPGFFRSELRWLDVTYGLWQIWREAATVWPPPIRKVFQGYPSCPSPVVCWPR